MRFVALISSISVIFITFSSFASTDQKDPGPRTGQSNGVVRNIDAWHEASGVGPEHEIYLPPEDRVNTW